MFTARAQSIIINACDLLKEAPEPVGFTLKMLITASEEPLGIAGVCLREANLTAKRLLIVAPCIPSAPDVSLDDITRLACREAAMLGHSYPGTEHLLLAICASRDCCAVRAIRKFGVSEIDLCRNAIEAVGCGYAWDEWRQAHEPPSNS